MVNLLDNQESIYEAGYLERMSAPDPSRLYHLEPIGMESPWVESFTSYVARLAAAHQVYVRALVTDEILPSLKQSHLHRDGAPRYDHLTTFWKRSATLNGTSPTTSTWVDALEQLTRRQDLRFLTMLPWAEVLSCRGCVRRTQAWCPACYQEWRETEQPIYQPLLWALEVIKVCPRHGIRLHERCPYQDCGQNLPHLAPHLQLGYCSHCQRWLGASSSGEGVSASTADTEQVWHCWANGAVGEMVAATPQFMTVPRQEAFAATIRNYIQQKLGGNFSLFARKLRVHRRTAWEWGEEQQKPQLAALLHVCAYFGVTPTDFFFRSLLETVLPPQPSETSQASAKKARKSYRKFAAERLYAALDAALQNEEMPPPSMQELGRRLGYDASHLAKHFPEHCHEISARYRRFQQSQRLSRLQQACSEVKQMARTLYSQKRFPSERQVGKGLNKRGALREYAIRAALKDTVRTIGDLEAPDEPR